MTLLYNLVPLILFIYFFYNYLKLTNIIVREDEQEQKDYEEYTQTSGNSKKIFFLIASIFWFISFLYKTLF